MPCRSLILDLRRPNSSICRFCLLAIQRQTTQPRIAAYSSEAVSSKARTKARTLRNHIEISRKPSKSELAGYLQGLKDLQQMSESDERTDGFSVRFFEEDGYKRSELPNDAAFGESIFKLDGSELREALHDIQSGLGSRGDREAFQAVLRDVGGGDLNRIGSASDLEKMVERMDKYTKTIDHEIENAGANLPQDVLDELRKDLSDLPLSGESCQPRVVIPQISEKPWTLNQRKKISRLNLSLARAFRESRRGSSLTKNTVSAVYKAYHAARIPLARSWINVQVDVWDLLWKVLSADESINLHRMAHVALLSRDMSEAKVTLSPSQQLLTIEAVFVDGWESKAIANWKRCVSTLGDETAETFQSYWELGVRIFCRVGDVEQAERAAERLLKRDGDPRILMPLIRTLSEHATPESQERAWNAYRKMRGHLGKEMKLADYDQVISYFLTTNQMENALYTFVDMMSDGEIDLKKQKYMPSVVANKFFLGKWLKRLIGAGDLDGAFRVVKFMRQKGVDASPIHLNGLIGAWQRSGGVTNLERADKLAWDMIESRICFVRCRASEHGSTVTASANSTKVSSPPSWPRATLETFSLLAENYRSRELGTHMAALWDAFHDAKISPDAFMMNQLLESHIQAGQPQEALRLYQSFVADRGISPDSYTFSALWKTLAVNRLHILSPHSLPEEIRRARELFSETIKHKSIFEPEGIDTQLARKMLHTFRRLTDNAGFVVALAALNRAFQFRPTETLALELVLKTTKLQWDSPSQRRRLILAKRSMDQELLACAGGDVEKLDEGGRRQDVLSEYLQRKYWPSGEEDEATRLVVREAIKQMGVYELLLSK